MSTQLCSHEIQLMLSNSTAREVDPHYQHEEENPYPSCRGQGHFSLSTEDRPGRTCPQPLRVEKREAARPVPSWETCSQWWLGSAGLGVCSQHCHGDKGAQDLCLRSCLGLTPSPLLISVSIRHLHRRDPGLPRPGIAGCNQLAGGPGSGRGWGFQETHAWGDAQIQTTLTGKGRFEEVPGSKQQRNNCHSKLKSAVVTHSTSHAHWGQATPKLAVCLTCLFR